MPPVGVTLGILIGLITGLIFLLILWITAVNIKVSRQTGQKVKDPRIIALLFSIPVCWAGGYFGNTAILGSINFEEISAIYFAYLLSTFGLIIVYPSVILIIRVVRDMGK